MKSASTSLITLPPDFLLGTASAATQIEGGATNHSWYRWSSQGNIKDGSSSITADDHWNRVTEDTNLMAELGLHTVRIGLEWSRLQPEPSRYDESALAHYRDEILQIRTKGMRPLVTLHHFSNPLWFEDSGAFLRGDSPQIFLGFVRFVLEGLGDIVSDWITFNEPSVYMIESYVWGEWPPAHQNMGEFFRGSRHIIKAHQLAYQVIHEIRTKHDWHIDGMETHVGIAHHVRVFDPLHWWNPLAWLGCKVLQFITQDRFIRAMTGRPGRRYADFLGLNYYTRDIVALAWNPAGLFTKLLVKKNAPVNELGWEIYPDGLGRVIRHYGKEWELPVWITENGTADATDAFRSQYLTDHLAQIAACIDEGIEVDRYYHWTLMDNFEWIEGYTPRFGLIEVDYQNQKRTIRPSGRLFAQICANRSWVPS